VDIVDSGNLGEPSLRASAAPEDQGYDPACDATREARRRSLEETAERLGLTLDQPVCVANLARPRSRPTQRSRLRPAVARRRRPPTV
ncbi:MAG: hypothetical protein AAFQ82_19805, partial [Myxococcota bacterium]